MTSEQIEKLPELLTVEQARQIVKLGKGKMYELIRQNKDFPAIKISPRQTRVIKTEFINWIKTKFHV